MNPLFRCALAPLLLTAALVAQTPGRWHGVPYTLPKGWVSQAQDDALLLAPAGVPFDGTGGEGYGLLHDGDLSGIDDAEFVDALTAAAEDMLEGAKQKGDARGSVGALNGRTVSFSKTFDNGAVVELRFVAFPAEGGVSACFIVAEKSKLAAREPELKLLLDSIGRDAAAKPKRRAFGQGKKTPDENGGEGTGGEGSGGEQPKEEEVGEPKSGKGNPLLRRKRDVNQEPEVTEPAKGFVRIPGAQEQNWCGIQIDVPADWKSQAGEQDALLLMPPDFGQSGVLDEIYALCGDGSLKSLDAEDASARIQQALEEIQPGLTLRGAPTAGRFGAISGKEFSYRGQTPDGQDVEAVLYAFPTPGGVRALLALGFPTKLQARRPLLTKMLGSMRPAKGGKAGGGGVAEELVGTWQYFASLTANNGGGRTNEARFTLGVDGSYVYSAENCSTNPFGAAWGNARSSGRWTATADTITFVDDSGAQTYTLEKRNHPKNNDPMLVLDGKCFVTVFQKRPW